jgi:peptide/nickel transport system permease protein
MDFVKFFARRLGRLLLTVFIISTLVFFVVRVIPGDPALIIAGMDASPEDVQAIRVKLGTDKPLLSQYLVWLSQLHVLTLGRP